MTYELTQAAAMLRAFVADWSEAERDVAEKVIAHRRIHTSAPAMDPDHCSLCRMQERAAALEQ